jgi:protein-disulfide isomerase
MSFFQGSIFCVNVSVLSFDYYKSKTFFMEPHTTTQISKSGLLVSAIALIGFGYLLAGATGTPPTAIKDTQKPVTQNEQAAAVTATTPADAKKINYAPLTPDDHVIGDLATAKVVLVEYSDLECPYCKVFHETLKTVVATYGNKIAWVYRHFPLDSLHPKARKEAEASECAWEQGGNDGFWKYADKIFSITPSNNGLAPELLSYAAEKNGLDVKKFDECLASGRYAEKIQKSVEDGNRIGVEGTPYTLMITKDGTVKPLSGAYKFEQLQAQIDILLK